MCVCVYVYVCVLLYIYVCVCVCVCVCLPIPLLEQDVTLSHFFLNGVLPASIRIFSFSSTGCHIKAKELSFLCYLSITRRRIIGFIPFLLAQ